MDFVLSYLTTCFLLLLLVTIFGFITYFSTRNRFIQKKIMINPDTLLSFRAQLDRTMIILVLSVVLLLPVMLSLYLISVLFFIILSAFNILSLVIVGLLLYGLIKFLYLVYKILNQKSINNTLEIYKENDNGIWKINNYLVKRLGVESVDKIIIHPNTEFSVEYKIFNKIKYKVLNIGIVNLMVLPSEKMMSIMAHEYGHVSYDFQIKYKIVESLRLFFHLVNESQKNESIVRFFNLAFYFSKYIEFLINLLVSNYYRINEYLADYTTICEFGSSLFIDSLTHFIKVDLNFNANVISSYKTYFNEAWQKEVVSPYNRYLLNKEIEGQQKQNFLTIITKKSTLFDTHPTISERILYAKELNIENANFNSRFNVDITNIESFFIEYHSNKIKTTKHG